MVMSLLWSASSCYSRNRPCVSSLFLWTFYNINISEWSWRSPSPLIAPLRLSLAALASSASNLSFGLSWASEAFLLRPYFALLYLLHTVISKLDGLCLTPKSRIFSRTSSPLSISSSDLLDLLPWLLLDF